MAARPSYKTKQQKSQGRIWSFKGTKSLAFDHADTYQGEDLGLI